MRLQIGFRVIMLFIIMALSTTVSRGQNGATTSNPGEYLAIQKGEDGINSKITKQTNSRKKEAGIQAEISASTATMREWEQQYNKYLKTTK